jgi:hypothetical protein
VLLADSPEEAYKLKHASTHLHEGVTSTVHTILTFITWLTGYGLRSLNDLFVAWTTPETTSLQLGTLINLSRSKSQLVAENALLRQHLIILRRQMKRPACTKTDRILLVLLASRGRTWKQGHITRSARVTSAVASSGPQTLVEVQVEGSFSQAKNIPGDRRLDQGDGKGQPTLGAERIRGELLKLGIHVSKRTIQKYMRQVRATRPRGQTWRTFIHAQAQQIWPCDFLPITDLLPIAVSLLQHPPALAPA